jgi:glycosyltransferase involved in cell wall biosynthesis
MRVMLLCRSLGFGGTERQLVELARGLARRGHEVTVATFYADDAANPLGAGLASAGLHLAGLEKRGRWDVLGFLARFILLVRRSRPQVIYAFLPVPNLVSLVARLAAPRIAIVWSVRAAFLDFRRYDRLSRFAYWLEARLARYADLTIANSSAGRDYVRQRGFPGRRLVVVPNGVDTDRFHPDSIARDRLRAEWGVGPETSLIGLVSRIEPEKGIALFVDAAATLAPGNHRLRFAIIGDGSESHRAELAAQAERLGLGPRLRWLPARNDVEAVYNALDLLVQSSPNEGMPNVVLEAMACGTSVAATKVGDTAAVVGECGIVVPPGDPAALADAILRQLARAANEGETLAAACRRRIVENYSLDAMVARTEALLQPLATDPRRRE